MALKITDECINCDVCEPECPNDAISMGETVYVIDPMRCTECVGHFDEPQCRQVCPVECIPVHPDFVETREQLMQRYRQLTADTSDEADDRSSGEEQGRETGNRRAETVPVYPRCGAGSDSGGESAEVQTDRAQWAWEQGEKEYGAL